MRVRFTKDMDYTPSQERRVTIAYLSTGGANGDGEYTVKRECGEAAVKAGAAVEVDAPLGETTAPPFARDAAAKGAESAYRQASTAIPKDKAKA